MHKLETALYPVIILETRLLLDITYIRGYVYFVSTGNGAITFINVYITVTATVIMYMLWKHDDNLWSKEKMYSNYANMIVTGLWHNGNGDTAVAMYCTYYETDLYPVISRRPQYGLLLRVCTCTGEDRCVNHMETKLSFGQLILNFKKMIDRIRCSLEKSVPQPLYLERWTQNTESTGVFNLPIFSVINIGKGSVR
jgi:hypothetical protein